MTLSTSVLSRLVGHFPQVRFAAAYGSAVYPAGRPSSMVDLVFAVDKPFEWHSQNLEQNYTHYSGIRVLGAKSIASVQDWAAGIYYNPYVRLPIGDGNSVLVKYGVIGVEKFRQDLQDWKWLYVSGRLQKPVKVLVGEDDQEFSDMIRRNREHAAKVALLLLDGQEISEEELFVKISEISYSNDIRMGWGEPPNKVKSVVARNMQSFTDTYKFAVDEFFRNSWISQNPSTTTRRFKVQIGHNDVVARILVEFPLNLRRQMLNLRNAPLDRIQDYQLWKDIAQDRQRLKILVRGSLRKIVGKSSLAQSLKGVLTGGIFRSATYIKEKITKARTSEAK